jgi:hypothetical protein
LQLEESERDRLQEMLSGLVGLPAELMELRDNPQVWEPYYEYVFNDMDFLHSLTGAARADSQAPALEPGVLQQGLMGVALEFLQDEMKRLPESDSRKGACAALFKQAECARLQAILASHGAFVHQNQSRIENALDQGTQSLSPLVQVRDPETGVDSLMQAVDAGNRPIAPERPSVTEALRRELGDGQNLRVFHTNADNVCEAIVRDRYKHKQGLLQGFLLRDESNPSPEARILNVVFYPEASKTPVGDRLTVEIKFTGDRRAMAWEILEALYQEAERQHCTLGLGERHDLFQAVTHLLDQTPQTFRFYQSQANPLFPDKQGMAVEPQHYAGYFTLSTAPQSMGWVDLKELLGQTLHHARTSREAAAFEVPMLPIDSQQNFLARYYKHYFQEVNYSSPSEWVARNLLYSTFLKMRSLLLYDAWLHRVYLPGLARIWYAGSAIMSQIKGLIKMVDVNVSQRKQESPTPPAFETDAGEAVGNLVTRLFRWAGAPESFLPQPAANVPMRWSTNVELDMARRTDVDPGRWKTDGALRWLVFLRPQHFLNLGLAALWTISGRMSFKQMKDLFNGVQANKVFPQQRRALRRAGNFTGLGQMFVILLGVVLLFFGGILRIMQMSAYLLSKAFFKIFDFIWSLRDPVVMWFFKWLFQENYLTGNMQGKIMFGRNLRSLALLSTGILAVVFPPGMWVWLAFVGGVWFLLRGFSTLNFLLGLTLLFLILVNPPLALGVAGYIAAAGGLWGLLFNAEKNRRESPLPLTMSAIEPGKERARAEEIQPGVLGQLMAPAPSGSPVISGLRERASEILRQAFQDIERRFPGKTLQEKSLLALNQVLEAKECLLLAQGLDLSGSIKSKVFQLEKLPAELPNQLETLRLRREINRAILQKVFPEAWNLTRQATGEKISRRNFTPMLRALLSVLAVGTMLAFFFAFTTFQPLGFMAFICAALFLFILLKMEQRLQTTASDFSLKRLLNFLRSNEITWKFNQTGFIGLVRLLSMAITVIGALLLISNLAGLSAASLCLLAMAIVSVGGLLRQLNLKIRQRQDLWQDLSYQLLVWVPLAFASLTGLGIFLVPGFWPWGSAGVLALVLLLAGLRYAFMGCIYLLDRASSQLKSRGSLRGAALLDAMIQLAGPRENQNLKLHTWFQEVQHQGNKLKWRAIAYGKRVLSNPRLLILHAVTVVVAIMATVLVWQGAVSIFRQLIQEEFISVVAGFILKGFSYLPLAAVVAAFLRLTSSGRRILGMIKSKMKDTQLKLFYASGMTWLTKLAVKSTQQAAEKMFNFSIIPTIAGEEQVRRGVRLSTFFTLGYTLQISAFGILFWIFTCLHFFSPILLFFNLGLIIMVTLSPLVLWAAAHQGRGRLHSADNLHNSRVALDEALQSGGVVGLEQQIAGLLEKNGLRNEPDRMRLAHYGLTHPARIKALWQSALAGQPDAETIANYQSRRFEHMIESAFDEWLVQTRQSRVEMETLYLDVYGQELLGLELSELELQIRHAGINPETLPDWSRLVGQWQQFSPLERYKQVCLLENRLCRRLLSSNLANRMWLKFREVDRQELLERFAQEAPESVRAAVGDARLVAQVMELFPRNPADCQFYKERKLYMPILLKVMGPVALVSRGGQESVDYALTRHPALMAFLLASGAVNKTELAEQLTADSASLRLPRAVAGLLRPAIGYSRELFLQEILPKARRLLVSRAAGFGAVLALVVLGMRAWEPQAAIRTLSTWFSNPVGEIRQWFPLEPLVQWAWNQPVWRTLVGLAGKLLAAAAPVAGQFNTRLGEVIAAQGLSLGYYLAGKPEIGTAGAGGQMFLGMLGSGSNILALLIAGIWLVSLVVGSNGLLLLAGGLLTLLIPGIRKFIGSLINKNSQFIHKFLKNDESSPTDGGRENGLLKLPKGLTGEVLQEQGVRDFLRKGILAYGIYRLLLLLATGLGLGAQVALGPFTGLILGLAVPLILMTGVVFSQGWLVRQTARLTDRLLQAVLPENMRPERESIELTISRFLGYVALGLLVGLVLLDLHLAAVPMVWKITAGFGVLYGGIRLAAYCLEKVDLERWWNAREFTGSLARAYRLALQVSFQKVASLSRNHPRVLPQERNERLQLIFIEAFDLFARTHFLPGPQGAGEGGGQRLDRATAIWRETIEPAMLRMIFEGNIPERLQKILAELPVDSGFELYWQEIQRLSESRLDAKEPLADQGKGQAGGGGSQAGNDWLPGFKLLFPQVESASSIAASPTEVAEPLANWQLIGVLQEQGKRWRLSLENAL